MSLCIRAVISSRCKWIPVQVGPLIYSSKGFFINSSLISIPTHSKSWCESESEEMCDSTSSTNHGGFILAARENMGKEGKFSNARLRKHGFCVVV